MDLRRPPLTSRLLADTNVPLRFAYSDEKLHSAVVASLGSSMARGYEVVFAPQSLREFWNVSTRSVEANGFGRTIHKADNATRLIEANFALLYDTDAMHATWRRLVVDHEVKGVQVHDARLAASALVGGCRAILTLNDPDFKR